MSEPMHCYRHPKRETRVSCATCGRPICTECMRQTEVGIKCPEDARLPRGARAGVMKPNQILKTVLAGAGIAAHLHQHVVPRWMGDQNFMPIIGRTKTLPELLVDTRALLAKAWS